MTIETIIEKKIAETKRALLNASSEERQAELREHLRELQLMRATGGVTQNPILNSPKRRVYD